jgi:50S ribosomal protein L16 3-hydroxylase
MSWLADTSLRRFGKLTPAQFLRDHWQQKPLFVKNAVPEIAGLLDGNELAGLALEDNVESRLVIRHPRNRWELKRGPFTAKTFKALPPKDWTLLVQAVDHFLPEAAELLERFNFLPHWRIDDLMVSYAVDGGGVGPHYDSYDVFLIQGIGTRVWKTGPAADDRDLLPHPDLRILKKMAVTDEFVCEPGDLLYLPPRLAHWGVARGECMTYSVGFRAPSDRELLDGFCNHLLAQIPELQHYGDAGLPPTRHPGRIDAAAIEALRTRLQNLVSEPRALEEFLGRWLSEPKYAEHETVKPARRYTRASLAKALAKATGVRRDEGSRFLLVPDPFQPVLFIDGNGHALEGSGLLLEIATRIADRRILAAGELAPLLDDDSGLPLLLKLFNDGHLYFDNNNY